MEFRLEQAINFLRRTPETLRTMLKDLPPGWADKNEGSTSWSPYDVVGHLVHGELTDWIPRARTILSQGENVPFEPFDRFAQFEASKGKSLGELLSAFETLRTKNLQILEEMAITTENLRRTGRHPELGRVTLEQLLATWVAHDLDHIVQIARTLAKQYGDSVGPWKAYLSILKS